MFEEQSFANGSFTIDQSQLYSGHKYRVAVRALKGGVEAWSSREFWIGGTNITVNGWLNLQTSQTVAGGRIVNMPSGMNRNTWYAFFGRTDPRVNGNIKDATVNVGSKGEFTDENGRYWVAVGPNVMNPSHLPTEGITAAEMKYKTKIDAVLTDDSGQYYYVPGVVGDVKAHTYPTGIVQTGNAFPNGIDPHPGNNDGSVFEFMGQTLSQGLGISVLFK